MSKVDRKAFSRWGYIPLAWSDPEAEAALWFQMIQNAVACQYPVGSLVPGEDHYGSTITMVATAVGFLDDMLMAQDPPIHLDLKRTRKRNEKTQIHALVMYSGRKTEKIPMEVTAGLIEIDGEPHSLSHAYGASILVGAIMDAVRAKFPKPIRPDSLLSESR